MVVETFRWRPSLSLKIYIYYVKISSSLNFSTFLLTCSQINRFSNSRNETTKALTTLPELVYSNFVSPQNKTKNEKRNTSQKWFWNIYDKGHCFLLRLEISAFQITRNDELNCHSTLYQRVCLIELLLTLFSHWFPSSFPSRTFYRNRFQRLGYYYFHFMTDKSLVSLAIILFASRNVHSWSTQGKKKEWTTLHL